MKYRALLVYLMCIATAIMHGSQVSYTRQLCGAMLVAAPIILPALYYIHNDSKTYEGTLNNIKFQSFNNWSHFQIGFATGLIAPLCVAVARESYQEMYAMLTSNRAVCAGFISGLSCYITIPCAAKIVLNCGH